MDQTLRNKLRAAVTQCRRLLEVAVAEVLQGQFGIHATGKKDEVLVEDAARMGHLSAEDRGYREQILIHLDHTQATGFKPQEKPTAPALQQLIREVAFTHLNRLCAYKMMETRGLIREAVGKGLKSQGFLFYLADHDAEERLHQSGHQDVAYRHFLRWLGGTLSEEIGILFSPHDPANRLFPPQRVLDDVLELINDEDLKGIWTEDEAIGWVYQYFTPKELRDQVRKESAAPRNSYELAFRNQFFTPRYVVEFLADNTLGRIWYEMRKGETSLKDRCRYLVRRPTEVFLKEGETAPEDASAKQDLPQEELLRQPVYVPHRAQKDPRDLKILDPACGSGHFLLYCFDLLLVIYEEAYTEPDPSSKLRQDFPTLNDLRKQLPALILSHNLHGIDIDRRATQIAALALWLRALRAWSDMGEKKDRPKVTRTNIVCAEPMPGEGDLLEEFLAGLQPKLLGQLVRVVFEKMKLAGEAGSLLKIEKEIRETVEDAKRQWVAEREQGTDRRGRTLLFSRAEMERVTGREPQGNLFDVFEITDEQFWQEAEDKVVDALREYARQATNGKGFQRQLFAGDAERGFAFVDLCRQTFDVALMTPPFGSPSLIAEAYLHDSYSDSKYESYGQFLARMLSLCNGYIGAITSRAYLYLVNCKNIRQFAYRHLFIFLDLGEGVLDDAMVEVCAYVLANGKKGAEVYCLDARKASLPTRDLDIIPSIVKNAIVPIIFDINDAREIDDAPFCYDTHPAVLRMFKSGQTIESVLGGVAKVGLATGENERFIRCCWEVHRELINNRWRWHAKGGDYLPFKPDVHLVVDWLEDGTPIEESFAGARIRKTDVYFRPAVTYSRRSQKGLSFRVLPAGCICSEKGPVIITPGNEEAVLALANSTIFKRLVEMQCSFGAFEIGTVQRVPLPPAFLTFRGDFHELGKILLKEFLFLSCLDETDVFFHWIVKEGDPASLTDAARLVSLKVESHRERACEQLRRLDDVAIRAYGLNLSYDSASEHRKMLEVFDVTDMLSLVTRLMFSVSLGYSFGNFPKSAFTWDQNAVDPFHALPQGQFCSALSQKHADSDRGVAPSIMPDDPEHKGDLVRRLREVLEFLWQNRAEAIEKEACEILEVKELRDYFRKPGSGGFWDDHVKRYSKSRRKAPINYTEMIDRYVSLGSHLNARDVKAVRKTVSGLIKLLYPHGEVTKEEMPELVELALEGRRRVKEQLKKMGSFEYHHTSFSYIDNETREEKFVGVPEQGGRNLFAPDPLAPGSVYTASVDDQGKVGLYRLEVGCSPGTGKLKIAGGVQGVMKESVTRAFAYLMGQKARMGVAQIIDQTDFHVEAIDLLANHVPCEAGVALVVAVYSAVKKQSAVAGLLVLGDLSIQGNIKAMRSLTEALQVAMDNGARKALVPLENKRTFLEVSGDILEKVDPIFYSDPATAAMKALGVN